MSKKTLKPRRLLFVGIFLYGLLFWCFIFASVFSFLIGAMVPDFTAAYVVAGLLALSAIGIGFLRKVRRKAFSLALSIQPVDLPYTSDELKHYLGLQPNDNFSEEYLAMVSAYCTMSKSKMIQIITSSEKNTERRSAGDNIISTADSKLKAKQCPVLFLKQEVPTLLDIHRNIYYLLPHFVIRIAGKKDISALSYADFDLRCHEGSCILGYEDKVPKDTEVVGRAYEHSNIDGTPDARVKDNPSTPIIRTGKIHVEKYDICYQLSNSDATRDFYEKYCEFEKKAIDAENLKQSIKDAVSQIHKESIKEQ